MSIIAYPLEATEYTAEDVQSYLSTRTSGVYSEDITFTPEGMTVTVSPFLAWFNYAKFKGCSVAVTEPETLTFSPAHAALHRADRIVLRLDFTVNKAYLTVLKGADSSYPVSVPTISRSEAVYDLCLATVFITAGSTEILESDITSELLNDKVCGIMRDGVTGIPTAQLQTQVEELILRLHESITGVQEGSAFMLGEIYDPQKKAKEVAFLEDLSTLRLNIDNTLSEVVEQLDKLFVYEDTEININKLFANGFLTTGSTQIVFNVPIGKNIEAQSVSVEKLTATIRGVSGYVNGSGVVDYTNGDYTIVSSIQNENTIQISITHPSLFLATANNTPVSLFLEQISLNFS